MVMTSGGTCNAGNLSAVESLIVEGRLRDDELPVQVRYGGVSRK